MRWGRGGGWKGAGSGQVWEGKSDWGLVRVRGPCSGRERECRGRLGLEWKEGESGEEEEGVGWTRCGERCEWEGSVASLHRLGV